MIKVLTDHYSLRYFGRIYGFEVVFTYAALLNYFAPFLLFLFFFPFSFSHPDPWTPHTTRKGHLGLSFNETEIIVVLLEKKKKSTGEQFNTKTSGKKQNHGVLHDASWVKFNISISEKSFLFLCD